MDLGIFPRIAALPPYVLAEVTAMTREKRRANVDEIDLGMGTPDGHTPEVMIEKLRSAAGLKKNNRYTSTVGALPLRQEIVKRYQRDYRVTLDAEAQTIVTVGVKDALAHLPVALLGHGDSAVTHSPSYPIHIYGTAFAGGVLTVIELSSPEDFLNRLEHHYRTSTVKPRMVLVSFPHNPTTHCVELDFFQPLVSMAMNHGTIIVHDFAYSKLTFDGYRAPSILQVPGAEEVAVELISLSKEFNISGWRCGFCVGNSKIVGALRTLKSYIDYGVPLPIQIASIVGMRECGDDVENNRLTYQRRRDVFVGGLNRIGWEVASPHGTIFVWARIPEQYRDQMDSRAFAQFLLEKAQVACSPGVGFGPLGEGWVRFALVENEGRLRQAIHNIDNAFSRGRVRKGKRHKKYKKKKK